MTLYNESGTAVSGLRGDGEGGRAEFWISGVMRVDVVGMDTAYSS